MYSICSSTDRLFTAVLSGMFVLTLAMPAQAQCPQLQQNMELIRESDRYLRNTPDPRSQRRRSPTGYAEWNHSFGPVNDSLPIREVDYLTVSLSTVDDLNHAKEKADDLMKQGKVDFAKKIRARVATASVELFGQPVTDKELVCISVAEQLRDRAWKCEKRGLFDMATKLYQKVIAIYQKEVGASPKTAGVLADLARVQAANRQLEAANFSYVCALKIYDTRPNFSDTEMASVLESYGGFLQDSDSRRAEEMFARAAQVRKREIKKQEDFVIKQRKAHSGYPKFTNLKESAIRRSASGPAILPSLPPQSDRR